MTDESVTCVAVGLKHSTEGSLNPDTSVGRRGTKRRETEKDTTLVNILAVVCDDFRDGCASKRWLTGRITRLRDCGRVESERPECCAADANGWRLAGDRLGRCFCRLVCHALYTRQTVHQNQPERRTYPGPEVAPEASRESKTNADPIRTYFASILGPEPK